MNLYKTVDRLPIRIAVSLLVWILASTNLTYAAEPARVGLLICQVEHAKVKMASFHSVYFTKSKTWVGEKVQEDLSHPSVIETREKTKALPMSPMLIAFDGKAIGVLEVPLRSEFIKELPAAAADKCRWLKMNGRRKVLLTTTRKKFSDPEHWKPTSFQKLGMPDLELRKQLAKFARCGKPAADGAKEIVAIGDFKIGRVYRAGDGKRALLEFSSLCHERFPEAPEGYNQNSKAPWAVWLFRDQNSQWAKQLNVDMVDIGDFDGDGKSEGIFFAGYSIPHGQWALFELQNFGDAVIASDEGY